MKKLVFACVLLVGLASLGAGCKDKCQTLADTMAQRYEECGVADPAGSSGKQPPCTEALGKKYECYTPCYENLDCVLLTEPGSAAANDAAKPFNECIADCDNAK